MWHVDRYGLALTAGADAVSAYNRGIGHLLRLERGAVEAVASAVAFDPTFALGHAALALLGHEFCAPVDVAARLRDARLHARRSTERERSHVHAVDRHLAGDSAAPGPAPRALPRRRAAAVGGGAHDRLRRGDHGAGAGVADRGALRPGVRQRLVVRRPARVHAPGAGPVRRGDGPLPRVARSRARRRSLGPRPGPRALRDRATTPPDWPGWTTGSPATARASTASATSPGTPPCTSCRSATSTRSGVATTPSSGRPRTWAVAASSTPGRCSGGGR